MLPIPVKGLHQVFELGAIFHRSIPHHFRYDLVGAHDFTARAILHTGAGWASFRQHRLVDVKFGTSLPPAQRLNVPALHEDLRLTKTHDHSPRTSRLIKDR